MTRIGVLSDSHSDFDPKILHYFSDCDEIWHAGDIGNLLIIDKLKAVKKTRAVYGNIDNAKIRSEIPEVQIFEIENCKILITHIAGTFENYNKNVKNLIAENRPDILVCGHSHILKVAYDKTNQLLFINPGACGKSGFHQVRTLIRFNIDGSAIQDMEVIELLPRFF
jgi:putative phosphoesterase